MFRLEIERLRAFRRAGPAAIRRLKAKNKNGEGRIQQQSMKLRWSEVLQSKVKFGEVLDGKVKMVFKSRQNDNVWPWQASLGMGLLPIIIVSDYRSEQRLPLAGPASQSAPSY